MQKSQPRNNFSTIDSHRPVKRLGQNFLINSTIVDLIIEKSKVDENSNVIEIGPGTGNLTQKLLLKVKKLVAVEIDPKLFVMLKDKIQDPKFEVLNEDILKDGLNKALDLFDKDLKVDVIANIPYYISSKIIVELLKNERINKIVIMLQKEMAERITAKVDSPHYNGFSIYCSLNSKLKRLIDVGRKNFLPSPNVDSVVVEISKTNNFFIDHELFHQFLNKCFSFKRKKLTNNLKFHFELSKIADLYKTLSFNENIRAEEIQPEIFIKMFNFFYNAA